MTPTNPSIHRTVVLYLCLFDLLLFTLAFTPSDCERGIDILHCELSQQCRNIFLYIFVQPSRSRWQLVFFITASLHASGNIAYVVLGTSREQQWTESTSDADVNVPSASADTDENAPLVADNVSNTRAYGTVDSVVS